MSEQGRAKGEVRAGGARMMNELGIPLQSLSPAGGQSVLSFPAKAVQTPSNIGAARERLLAAQG